MTRHLVWLRADLRCIDNTALLAACADPAAAVACVYAVTPGQWQQHDVAGVRVDFELRTLRELGKALAALNIPLLFLHSRDFSTVAQDLGELVQKHGIAAVHANRQYEVNEIARDLHVTTQLASLGVPLHLHHDQCVVPPGTLTKADGGFYSVFTPFKRVWLQRLLSCRPQPAPVQRRHSYASNDPVPDAVAGFASHVDAATAVRWWPAGEEAALARLSRFSGKSIEAYNDCRDLPAQPGTSRLSPYLAVGAVSPRQCLNAALRHQESHGESSGVAQWITELAWRDFYKHVVAGWPRVCRHLPFRPETSALPWRRDEEAFRRWCEGRTGFPLVDAAMRQLQRTGWMHNRLRMITAMFLTKDLFIDWRLGEKFFMQHLIDGDFTANNGGWQWSASTGNDAVPYFRIFNPIAQSRKFDREGKFIREYVPELRDFAGDIHDPHGRGEIPGLAYPPPMVDHGAARARTLAAFKALRMQHSEQE
jgi:deoxyribodipyrimidine photo-lyase